MAHAWQVAPSVVRGETPQGGRWLASDALLAAAYLQYEAGLCPDCGQPLDESTADDGSEDVRDSERRNWRYVMDTSEVRACNACVAIERAADADPRIANSKHQRALRWPAVQKRPMPKYPQHN